MSVSEALQNDGRDECQWSFTKWRLSKDECQWSFTKRRLKLKHVSSFWWQFTTVYMIGGGGGGGVVGPVPYERRGFPRFRIQAISHFPRQHLPQFFVISSRRHENKINSQSGACGFGALPRQLVGAWRGRGWGWGCREESRLSSGLLIARLVAAFMEQGSHQRLWPDLVSVCTQIK